MKKNDNGFVFVDCCVNDSTYVSFLALGFEEVLERGATITFRASISDLAAIKGVINNSTHAEYYRCLIWAGIDHTTGLRITL